MKTIERLLHNGATAIPLLVIGVIGVTAITMMIADLIELI